MGRNLESIPRSFDRFFLADFLLNTEMPKKFFEQRKHKEGWIGKKNRRNVVSRRKKSKCVKEEREKECCMMEGSLCLLCCWCFVWTTPRTAVLLMIWYCSVVFDRGRRRRWTSKKKGRNKMMNILKGNIRILNVNLGNKGWDTFKSMLKNLQPDVLVATEPGDLTARPNIRGYQLISHKSIALALKEKTVQLIDHRDNICVWRTEGTKDEKKGKEKEKTSGKKGKGKAEDEIRRSDGKKTVTFNEQAEWTDKGKRKGKEMLEDERRKKVREKLPDDRILKTKVRMAGIEWEITSIYAPQRKDKERKIFWEKLEKEMDWRNRDRKSWSCLIGDYNAIAAEEETVGVSSAKALVIPCLKRWDEQETLKDIWKTHQGGKGLTRFMNESKSRGSRIDRIMVDPKIIKNLKRSNVMVGKKVSDHALLLWDFTLIKDNEWKRVVAEDNASLNWEKWNDRTEKEWKNWMMKQKFCSCAMKEKKPQEIITDFDKFCKEASHKIYDLIGIGNTVRRRKDLAKKAQTKGNRKIEKTYRNKMQEDEKQKILKKRKGHGMQEIFALKNGEKEWIEGARLETSVAKALERFGFEEIPDREWGKGFDPATEEDGKSLLEKPTDTEIQMILKKMKKGKACLKKDIPGFLLREETGELRRNFFEVVRTVWEKPELTPSEWARATVRLIPKPERNHSELNGWRPLAVGTTINKIMMMIWSKRIEKIAIERKWICERQYGFIKNRTMKGAADMINRFVDEGTGKIVWQWDLEKAFPSVNPFFICDLLRTRNVPNDFIKIYETFYKNARNTAVVAGVAGGPHGKCWWMQRWGLKQGCPASPIMLNLWTAPLVFDMNKVTRMIQYADDMWAIDNERKEESVKAILKEKLKKAGLKVNLEKEKRWNKNSLEALIILGMIVKEGKREKIKDQIDKTLIESLMRGFEREYRGWRKITYVNATVLSRFRHKLAVFWDKSLHAEIEEIENVIRSFIKAIEWPTYMRNDFLYDNDLGLGLMSLQEERGKDVICYVWSLQRQGEEVEEMWRKAWKNYCCGIEEKRIECWKNAVEKLTDTEVERKMYNKKKKEALFPLGEGLHLHKKERELEARTTCERAIPKVRM